MAVPNPMLTEFGIHHRLESCAHHFLETHMQLFFLEVVLTSMFPLALPKPLLTEFGKYVGEL